MIDYDGGKWQLGIICRIRGSVFPKAFGLSIPSMLMSSGAWYYFYRHLGNTEWEESGRIQVVWSGFTFMLGFLLVFRTQQAYSRYWEGVTLLRQSRGEWFNAYSSLLAFSNSSHEMKREVEAFQHLLARLMSMLSCVALQTITDIESDKFNTLDTSGMDVDSLRFLAGKKDANQRMEIIIQWIQRSVILGHSEGLLPVPAPIVTRIFQELARGGVNITHARNMTEIPFPFPYAQLLSLMLVINAIILPVVSGLYWSNPVIGTLFSFVTVFAFWGANLIAAEIESPFGNDDNDLPLRRFQEDVNASIWCLLEAKAQRPPKFTFCPENHRMYTLRAGSFSIVEGKEVAEEEAAVYMRQTTEQQKKMSFGEWVRFKILSQPAFHNLMMWLGVQSVSEDIRRKGSWSLTRSEIGALRLNSDEDDPYDSDEDEDVETDLSSSRPIVRNPRRTESYNHPLGGFMSRLPSQPASAIKTGAESPYVPGTLPGAAAPPVGAAAKSKDLDEILAKLGRCLQDYVSDKDQNEALGSIPEWGEKQFGLNGQAAGEALPAVDEERWPPTPPNVRSWQGTVEPPIGDPDDVDVEVDVGDLSRRRAAYMMEKRASCLRQTGSMQSTDSSASVRRVISKEERRASINPEPDFC